MFGQVSVCRFDPTDGVVGHGALLLNATNGDSNYGGGYYLTKTNTAQAIKLAPQLATGPVRVLRLVAS